MRVQNFFRPQRAGLAAVYDTSTGEHITDQQVRDFVSANLSNPKAVWDATIQHGINNAVGVIWNAFGGTASPYSQELIAEFLRAGSNGWTDWTAYLRSKNPAPAPAQAAVSPAPAPRTVAPAPSAPAPAPSSPMTARVSALVSFIRQNGYGAKGAIYGYILQNGMTIDEVMAAVRALGLDMSEADVRAYVLAGSQEYNAAHAPAPATRAPAPASSSPPISYSYGDSGGGSSLPAYYTNNQTPATQFNTGEFGMTSNSKLAIGIGVAAVVGVLLLNRRKG